MTVRFAADENFNRRTVTGLQRRLESLDIVRVQDAGLRTEDDPAVLAWAASEGRVLLTHDAATMPEFAYASSATAGPHPAEDSDPAARPDALRPTQRVSASLDR